MVQTSNKGVELKEPSIPANLNYFFILLAGFFLLGLMLIQINNFRWLGAPIIISEPYWNYWLLAALGLIAYGFYRTPPHLSSGDVPKWTAYSILAIVIAVAAILRMVRADQAYSSYWGDPAIEIADVCEIVQKHNFYTIFAEGGREPLFSYCAALIWWLLPTLKALLVQRLAANIISLTSIWILYRVGREISGKRLIGVIVAALAGVTKGLLILNICGMRVTTLTFGISLMMWAQIKLFKRTNLKHFLFWGAALVAGLYTYTVIRLWIPFLIFLTLGFVLWKNKNSKIHSWIKVAAFLLLVFYLSFYSDSLLGIWSNNFISKIWVSNFTLWSIWQGVFAGLFIYAYGISEGNERWLSAWALGVLVVGILSHPIALHPEVANRIKDQSLLPHTLGGLFSANERNLLLDRGRQTLLGLFAVGTGRSDMDVLGDCFYDFQASLVIVLGLIYAIVRPTWLKSFLVLCSMVALLPYWLTYDLHMAKISGTVTPMLLLAALAVGRLVEISTQKELKTKTLGLVFILGLFLFWGWQIRSSYQRVYDQWWWEVCSADVCVARSVDQFLPDKRVYLAQIPDSIPHDIFFDVNTQAVLHDNESTYLLQPTNVIDVRANEPRKDVVVIVSSLMKDLIQQIKHDFPQSTWIPTWQSYQKSHDEVPFLYSVVIPADQIPEKAGKLFSFNVMDGNLWRRKVYLYRLSLREGTVQYEDLSPTLNPPPPGAVTHAVEAQGQWDAPQDGDYRLKVEGQDYTQVFIDGRIVLYLKERITGSDSHQLFLKKGSHQIKIVSYLVVGNSFPILTVQNKGLNYKTVLNSL